MDQVDKGDAAEAGEAIRRRGAEAVLGRLATRVVAVSAPTVASAMPARIASRRIRSVLPPGPCEPGTA